jgi:hypothetical protein
MLRSYWKSTHPGEWLFPGRWAWRQHAHRYDQSSK